MRLSPAQLARWQGLPLVWVDARPELLAHGVSNPRPLLAMLDAGRGEATFRFPRRTVTLNAGAGTMGLFAPGLEHRSAWRCDAARRILVDLDLARLPDGHGLWPGWADTALRQDLEFQDPVIAGLLRQMVAEVAAGCPGGAAVAQGLSIELATCIWERLGPGPRRERGRLSAAQLRRVDALIDERLAEPLPLALLADAAGVSVSHFARLMKASVGCAPHRYVLQRRVARARQLLVASTLPIAAVAAATGFASQSHLTATLSRALGTTPAALRRRG